eukprot:CAMPEP_0203995292 /NCGR_PEP_ID=MMETSP0360-20130528/11970_1 /ASSEMBLY_ACC=CAM_ASM_000342 /TAXON_ID=268821 /ORGANISM="Scrippsiella Hangoei, Strain SHTV-5" /LENGTH=378 /DNA_ID=CAMNT_0050935969 /DNA_START=57 /DNA_END=1190 /DNA_ORIENTATION=+
MFCGSCCKLFGASSANSVDVESDAPESTAPSLVVAASPDAVACGHASKYPFEQFAPSMNVRELPIVLFNDDASQQLVWYNGGIKAGIVHCPDDEPDVWSRDAVVMSPAYLGFAIEPYEQRYLHYKGVGIMFSRPHRGKFMQPSIDTMLVCYGLDQLFQSKGCSFGRAIDIGMGSGFIGKFAAAKAPGKGRLAITLVDVDPAAEEYCRSDGFGATVRGAGGREVEWSCQTGDASALLQADSDFDLLISNPPYIPTREEVEEGTSAAPSNFWEGCGLLVHMLELMLEGRYRMGAHLVVMVTSLTLKAKRVQALLAQVAVQGLQVRVLVEREIAWKAWYAGSGRGPTYLLAHGTENDERQRLGSCEYFVGAMRPGDSRKGG